VDLGPKMDEIVERGRTGKILDEYNKWRSRIKAFVAFAACVELVFNRTKFEHFDSVRPESREARERRAND
jgi:hypothetical protein